MTRYQWVAALAGMVAMIAQAGELTTGKATTEKAATNVRQGLAASPRIVGTDDAADGAWTSIAELGFRDGWMFEGLDPGHRHAFRFRLPRAARVDGARLRVGFNVVAGLDQHSVLRVDVNGQPVYSASLARIAGTQWVELPLSRALLARAEDGALDVVLRASLLVSEDRCMDDRATASFLQIDPDSGLALALSPGENSVLAAWEMLPKRVELSLPAAADEHAFASALLLTRQLGREGKTVEVVRLPRLGDIVVASPDEFRAAVADVPGGVDALEGGDESANVRILSLRDRRVIAVTPQPAGLPATLADSGWMPVARGAAHDVRLAAPTRGGALPATLDEVSFDRLGAELSSRDVVHRAEWQIPLGVDRVPAGRVPAYARVSVTSAPVPEAQPMMLYAYLGEELQDVRRLGGGTEQFTLHFTAAAARASFNTLRLVVRRDVREGNCQSLVSGYPVQIDRGSSVVFEHHDLGPADFGALPRHFAGGYDLLLGREVLTHPEGALAFVANLINANGYPLAPERIRFVADTATKPSGPFLLVADEAPDASGLAVRFDRGGAKVSGHDGETILEIYSLPGLAVAQLADWNGQRGMWVRPPARGPLPTTTALALTFDSVAFIDASGVALTLSPDQPDIARLEYPAYRDWFDLFGAYRYWWMALGWLVVVALLAQLYVKVRSHKKAG